MGNKTSETDANGNKTIYEYDCLGHLILEKKQTTQTNLTTKQAETVTAVTKYFFDANGNKVKMIDPNGHIWLYSYSARGFLLSETDPVGNVTRYGYDPMGNRVAKIDPRKNKDAPLNWYSFSGNQLVCKDSRSDKSFTTWYLYDDYNRLYRTVMPAKTPPENPFVSTPNYDNPYTETWFGLSGNKISERDPNGIETKYTYSPRNWLETKIGPYSKEEYQYDGVGNQTQAKIWTDISADTYYTITKDYDSLGRLRQIAYPQSTEAYTYDPFDNRLTLKDGNGNLTEYKYNNLGWQVTVTDPLKNTTTYSYDPNGNKVATISAKKLYFINRYDAQNRVVETLDSLGVSTLYNYDCNGNLSGKLDPRSTRWEYVYNENNTLKQLKLTGADKTTYTVSYTYDQAGNRMTVSDTSRIRYAVTYNDLIPDPLNRINVVERQYEGKSYRMVYEYNQGGQVTALQYPGATAKITYQYNASGQLQEVKGFTKTTGITHYSDGLIKTLTQANNVTTQYTYDTGRRLRELNTSLEANSLLKLTYSFDLAGNITALGDSVSGRQSAYQYQPNNWLKQEATKGQKESRNEDYQYDSDGNRTQRTITLSGSTVSNYSYYPDTDRLLTDGKYGYVYDAAGNLIQKGNKFNIVSNKIEFTAKSGAGVEYWEYGYDLFNRLIKVQKNQQVVAQYGYDPEGFRVVKATSVGTTHYVFDGNEPVFEKQLKSGTIKSYIYASGKHLARVDGVIGDTAAKVYYYHTDHIGSIRKITDSQGKVVWNSDYAAFGTQENKSGSIEELHSFTGKELDPDTGLYYYNARWYDSDLGRFISEDPEVDPNNPNLYVYCANNPLISTDSTGEDWEFVDQAKEFGFGAYDFITFGMASGQQRELNKYHQEMEAKGEKPTFLGELGSSLVGCGKGLVDTFNPIPNIEKAYTTGDPVEGAVAGLKLGGLYSLGSSAVKTVADPLKRIVSSTNNKVANTLKAVGSETGSINLSGFTNENKVFTKSVNFNAGSNGTGINYKVFQRSDIDWNMVRTIGAKQGRGLTNAEAAAKYGFAPVLPDGSVATLHHSQQNAYGPLFEASTRYHNISNIQKAPLHPYGSQGHPNNPMGRGQGSYRELFQKVDSIDYWKWRGNQEL
jgi:RHS repeat-associated protein